MQQMHFLHRIRRKILGQTLRSIMLSEYSSPKLMSFVLILIALFAESASIVSASGEQSAVNSLINLQKRVDYRTCIDRFEVHRDTIIQTDDSRAMGATFLYHVEAANRDECLRDCCETDRCDVFVFEEKYQGSCFLFQCGPPTDFRCQFASHANYSIAVMSVQRYIKPQAPPPIPPQSHESQQVTQLKTLKGLEMAGKSMGQPPATPTTTTTTTTTTSPPTTAAVCGRFQFQCHSGECIAIYNACDGIPQCEDGSDETPACPSQAAAGVLNNNKKHSTQLELIRANNPPGQLHMAEEHNSNNFASRPYPGKVYEGSEGVSADAGYMSGTIEKPPPLRNREDPVSASGRYYNSQMPQQQQIQSLRNLPMPIQQQQQQSQDAMNGNNLLYSSNSNNNNNEGGDPMNRLPVSNSPLGRPVDNFYSGAYRDKYYYPSNGNNNQQQDQSPLQPVFINGQSNELRPWHSPVDSSNANQQYNNYNPSQQQQQQPQPPPFYLPSNNNGNNWPNAAENKNLPPVAPNSIPSGQQPAQRLPPANSAPQSIPAAAAVNADNQPAKIPDKTKPASKADDASSDEDSSEEPEATEAAPKKGKSRGKHRKLEKTDGAGEAKGMPVIPPIYQQLKAIGSELDAEIMDHDGHSDRPTGAVVSLVIGISITAVLAIFIGCRMKTVGRRIRRTGKGPYAHDADFLVNGMYL